MNQTLELLHTHHSTRSYTGATVSEEMLDQIIRAAWHGPTSMHAQAVSLVVTRDASTRARIAELAGGQAWIAQAPVFITLVMDFNKTEHGVRNAGRTQVLHESMEGYGAAAVDIGIALANLMIAARSLGLGVVPVGGIRRNPQAMIDLLQLPLLTFPQVGLCIGHVDKDAALKPRMDIATFRHDERYDDRSYTNAIAAHDQALMQYWQQLGRTDGLSWSQNLGNNYSKVYFPLVRPVAALQGLLNDK